MMRALIFRVSLLTLLISETASAETSAPLADTTTARADLTSQINACMASTAASADEAMTLKQLREACTHLVNNEAPATPATAPHNNQDTPKLESTSLSSPAPQDAEPHLLQDRLTMEALNRTNRFILMPNKRNYIMPVTYSDSPANAPYQAANDSFLSDLNHAEAELQLSVKILLRENIFNHNNGHLYLGYTNHALWQVYNKRISAPFREADHQPELILSFNNDWEILGFRNSLNDIILNHQSNGQSGDLSRSWNRIMLTSVFERGNFAMAFTPWYRIPEQRQDPNSPRNPSTDDNPDINHYMGRFELAAAYKYKADIFSVQIRNNLDRDNRGAIEATWTFPVTSTMRGVVSYFDGYGHSLIEYNVYQQVFGLGIIFTDFF